MRRGANLVVGTAQRVEEPDGTRPDPGPGSAGLLERGALGKPVFWGGGLKGNQQDTEHVFWIFGGVPQF